MPSSDFAKAVRQQVLNLHPLERANLFGIGSTPVAESRMATVQGIAEMLDQLSPEERAFIKIDAFDLD